MRFQVPQFIEVEDTIFGPLTLKQFIYLAAGLAASFILYYYLPFFISIFLILPIAGFAVALAFYKVNNKPFINVVEAAFKYIVNPRLFLWKKETKAVSEKNRDEAETAALFIPKLSGSKLKDLTWSLDVNQSGNQAAKGGGGQH